MRGRFCGGRVAILANARFQVCGGLVGWRCGTPVTAAASNPPLGTAIEYHDTALHKTLEIAIPEHTKLRWVRCRDQRTRDEMAQFINEGMPGGEAIMKAVENISTSGTWKTKPSQPKPLHPKGL